jgi:hypothetical protein
VPTRTPLVDPRVYGLPPVYPLPDPVETALQDGDPERIIAACKAVPIDPGPVLFRQSNRLGYNLDWPRPIDLPLRKQIEGTNMALATVAVLREHGGKHSLDEVEFTLSAAAPGPIHDRNAPNALYALVTGGALSQEGMRDGILWAWQQCEYPEANLSAGQWRTIFAALDKPMCDHDVFASEQDGAVMPCDPACRREGEPLTLYRGAIPSRRKGMAWTADRERAEWFRDRFNTAGLKTAHLYTATVEPRRVLARFIGRSEDEYVIDTKGLRVEQVAAPVV